MIIQRKLYYESFIRLGLKKVLILGLAKTFKKNVAINTGLAQFLKKIIQNC